MKDLIITIILLFIVFCLSACKNKEHVIAIIGEKKITEKTINKKLLNMPINYQRYVKKSAFARRRFIDTIIRENIILESAKKSGIKYTYSYKKLMNDFKRKQKQQLKEYSNSILMDIYIKEIYAKLYPQISEMLDYYRSNLNFFKSQTIYVVKHIFTFSLKDALYIHNKLKNGEDFSNIALKNFGINNFTAKSELVKSLFADKFIIRKGREFIPQVENTIYNIKNNRVSSIIVSPYGYHIIYKVETKKLNRDIKFDDVKQEVEKRIMKQKFKEWLNKKKKKLMIKTK
ncbi:MAG: peptidylprolyl isomerase [Endomicrobium sp.]|jgi:parvulin-like peptidyl-prolyl isomerase|nr:peptidylprolyl isomerase [Endomicrobium sp.]